MLSISVETKKQIKKGVLDSIYQQQPKQQRHKKSKCSVDDQREIICRKWAENNEIVTCMQTIFEWALGQNCDDDRLYENIYDWCNNILWYSRMKRIDPVNMR